ncbi:multidrug ABC transporter permease [Nonomuraea sp. TT08I-71]|nr:multidrug ABC transporter permease [Nonomuraea sp. TT08I-71]
MTLTNQRRQPRAPIGSAGAALRLAWRAAPGHVTALLAIAVVSGLVPSAVVWLTLALVDGLVAGGDAGTLTRIGAGLAFASLAAATAPHVTAYLEGEFGRRCARLLTDRLYEAVNGFTGMSRFEDPEVLDRIQLAEQATTGSVGPATTSSLSLARDATTVVTVLLSLAVLAPVMAVVVLVAAVPVLGAQLSLSRFEMRTMEDMTATGRRQMFYSGLISEPDAAKEVRLLGTGPYFKWRLLRELGTLHASQRGVDRRQLWVQAALSLLGAMIAGGGLLWAVSAAGTGRISIGGVPAFVAAVTGAQSAVLGLVFAVSRTYQALLLFGHFQAVVDLPDDLAPPSTTMALPALRYGIEIDDVWFRYDPAHPWVLRGVSLYIPAGRSLAIVGLNGAGKSTLIKLLCRLYDPEHGRITWDGVDIREVPVDRLRRRIGVVFQDFVQYDLTAAENVGLGDVDRIEDRSAVELAAVRAGIDGKLRSLPAGYDTLLTRMYFSATEMAEHGTLLSGGQWQRVALARALMRADADLTILDEPSSGLDAEAEYEIHRDLSRLRAGRTSVLISHRLGAVRAADHIVVLEDGRVVEEGDHAGLMAKRGRYEYLFQLQARGYDTGQEIRAERTLYRGVVPMAAVGSIARTWSVSGAYPAVIRRA